MRRLLLFLVILAAPTLPAYSQLTPGGPSGDFRAPDQSTGAPRIEPSSGSSQTPTLTMVPDTLGPKNPDEILKSIDKDLGRSTLERSDHSSPSFNLEKDLRSPSEHSSSLK
jgi:hypothetical protein